MVLLGNEGMEEGVMAPLTPFVGQDEEVSCLGMVNLFDDFVLMDNRAVMYSWVPNLSKSKWHRISTCKCKISFPLEYQDTPLLHQNPPRPLSPLLHPHSRQIHL